MPISPYFNPGYLTPEQIAMAGVGPNMEGVGSAIYMGPGGSQSYDRFKAEYQARTGDPLGDPFAGLGDPNAARAYNTGVANQWTQRQQLLQGRVPAIAGTEQVGPPTPATAVTQSTPAGAAAVARAAGSPLATLQPDPVAAANESAYYLRNPERRYDATYQDPRMQVLLDALKVRRMTPEMADPMLASSGMMPDRDLPGFRYKSAAETDPASPNYGVDPVVMKNKLFQEMARNDPTFASKAYAALTNTGYEGALASIKNLHTNREAFMDQMMKDAENYVRDPATGKMSQRVRRARPMSDMDVRRGKPTEWEDVYVPLTPIQQQFADSGEIERRSGFALETPSDINKQAIRTLNALRRTSGDSGGMYPSQPGTGGRSVSPYGPTANPQTDAATSAREARYRELRAKNEETQAIYRPGQDIRDFVKQVGNFPNDISQPGVAKDTALGTLQLLMDLYSKGTFQDPPPRFLPY